MGLPGFHGRGGQDFPLAAGSVYGYRWWSLDAPDLRMNPLAADAHWVSAHSRRLRGQTGAVWTPGENLARCNSFREHQAPVEECSSGCGFWAYWAPPERPHFSQNQLWLLGVIKGYGRTLFGSEGFRCQKAAIVALHLASQFGVAGQDGRPATEWGRIFSQPGTYSAPPGRPSFSWKREPQLPPVPAREMSVVLSWMQTWQAVIEDRLERLYPDARIITERRALLALYPPSHDRAQV